MILFLVLLQCTVQSGTVIGLCRVHGAELYCYWCLYSTNCSFELLLVFVYSAQCRLGVLLVCLECTVQNDTVIGTFTVHIERWDCYWCLCTVHSAE